METTIKSQPIETIIEPTKEEVEKKLKETYENIKKILEVYVDLEENYYPLIACWIIGTYFHNTFNSYPYLYFNAMRGSGKTRLLRLVCRLSKGGEVMTSPTEAVLFRTTGTLGIDEFERVANKDKASVRELLNGAYKKGTIIKRMKKNKTLKGEEQVVESFNVYRPILMANIWGMDEVLGDRCITLILEKSSDLKKTRLIEDFEDNIFIKKIIQSLNLLSKSNEKCSLCRCSSIKNIYSMWNNYISNDYKTTLSTLSTHTTYTTLTTQTTLNFFKKVDASKIQGRNLELFLPILVTAETISSEVLDEILKIAFEMSNKKIDEERLENIDAIVYNFISQQQEGLEYYPIRNLTNMFREFTDESGDWLNSKWFSRALKRNKLVIDSKRDSKGIKVLLDIPKAKKHVRMYNKNGDNTM